MVGAFSHVLIFTNYCSLNNALYFSECLYINVPYPLVSFNNVSSAQIVPVCRKEKEKCQPLFGHWGDRDAYCSES